MNATEPYAKVEDNPLTCSESDKSRRTDLTAAAVSGMFFSEKRRKINAVFNEKSDLSARQNNRKAVVEDVRMDYYAHSGYQLQKSVGRYDAGRASYGSEIPGIGR